jgi:hypothetical protein
MLVAGPLGTLPEFGDITCDQDVVVAATSDSMKLHNPAMPKALPLMGRALSARSLFTIPSGTLFSPLSCLFSAWFSPFPPVVGRFSAGA